MFSKEIKNLVSDDELGSELIKEAKEIEDKNNLLDILDVLKASFEYHFRGVEFENIKLDTDIKKVTKGDLIRFSQTLIDVHVSLECEMFYMPFDEYEHFSDMRDVVEYFLSIYDYHHGEREKNIS